jgi:drug/metabolite transporter (DMT)-like permease
MNTKTKASMALFSVVLTWGLTFPLIQNATPFMSPQVLVLARLIGSCLLFLPLLFWRRTRISWGMMQAGLIFGTLEAGCYLSQTEGLRSIGASESAFITALSVVMIPFLAPLFRLDTPRWVDAGASLFCLLGIFILTGAQLHHLPAGVYWTLLCALCYALSVLYLTRVTKRYHENHALVFCLLLGGLPIPLLLTWLHPTPIHWNTSSIVAIVFCSATTLLTYVMQSRFQKKLAMTHVAIIYAFEPILATFFAAWLQHTPLHARTFIGGAFVIAGFLLCQSWPKKTKAPTNLHAGIAS